MAKIQNSVSLSPEVWAQIDDLIPAFGESRGEVITHALNVWWTDHDAEIQGRKARIASLKPEIDKLVAAEADKVARRKKAPKAQK